MDSLRRILQEFPLSQLSAVWVIPAAHAEQQGEREYCNFGGRATGRILISFCPQSSEVVCLALFGRSLVLSEVLCVCDVKCRNDGHRGAVEAGAPPLMSSGASANHPGRLGRGSGSACLSACGWSSTLVPRPPGQTAECLPDRPAAAASLRPAPSELGSFRFFTGPSN